MPQLIISAREASISAGLSVKRILPFRQKRMVGPFIFMDHAGPINTNAIIPEMDVLPHPHIGLSTLTYLLDGSVTHRDSLGIEQLIRPGEVNWMTAGKGISHSERFEDLQLLKDGQLEMLQTWVALPEEAEEIDPSFFNYKTEQLPVLTDKGVWMRLIAGEAFNEKSDVHIHSPLFYLHAELEPKASIHLPKQYSEKALYIVKGSVEFQRHIYTSGQLLLFSKHQEPVFTAKETSSLMLLGGEPLGERFIWWNFVSSRAERIEKAKNDWRNGKIILPPNDNKTFVLLPDNDFRAASSKGSKPA